MASALPVISREEINFLRVANLLIRHSPKAVRILFNREFNPSGLTSVLSKNRNKLDKLKKKHVITQTQWSLLFPSGSVPDSSHFDLTLMVCLLRNLTKITIQDKLPQPSDLSEGAAVSRIKYYRNQIAHSDSGALSDLEFSKTFDEVSMAIEIICPPMKTDCETLKDAHIDHSVHDIYLEFVKNEKQMEEMKQKHDELVAQVEVLNVERQNIESRRKRLNFNKTPRQTLKSTSQSPVSPGPKVKTNKLLSVGDVDLKDGVRNMLRRVMTNELMSKFNISGLLNMPQTDWGGEREK
ncbi:unnamed protein product [Mytilus coruscus]|uniref:DZIP3-like HEPN domain-containing protein n=1 Tax=Mytilus coruscus TaxID=42192 RepID=A0A6J8C256_MYTCO|nr:unnamed protein product [Mytilus coruscus]